MHFLDSLVYVGFVLFFFNFFDFFLFKYLILYRQKEKFISYTAFFVSTITKLLLRYCTMYYIKITATMIKICAQLLRAAPRPSAYKYFVHRYETEMRTIPR